MSDNDIVILIDKISGELGKLAKNGLPTSGQGAEIAAKLVDMYDKLKHTQYMDIKGNYYNTLLDEMREELDGYSERGYSRDDGYSGRRNRDSRGRYSRDGRDMRGGYDGGNSYHDGRNMRNNDAYERYMESRQSYRSGKSGNCKDRLVRSAEAYMDEFTQQLQDMLRDSECKEERDAIMGYIERMRNLK